MTINDLQAFVMVYDLRHISNAAVELHLSQSELSKRMRALENELNIKLLDTHNKRRLQITPAGETFYHHAHKMITDYETMMHDLAPNRPTTFAKLIIGAIPISGQYNIAKRSPLLILSILILKSKSSRMRATKSSNGYWVVSYKRPSFAILRRPNCNPPNFKNNHYSLTNSKLFYRVITP